MSAPVRDTTASFTMRAIGTTAQVVVTDPARIDLAAEILRTQLREIDMAASRFRDDSELARVNGANGRAVPIGPLLMDAIRIALRVSRDTEGLVDPTIGGSMVSLGWDRDFTVLDRTVARRAIVRRTPGWKRVEVDAAAGTVRIPPGAELDLGATAKAFAADRAATAIAMQLGCGVLVNLGGDISTAGPPPSRGWLVRLAEDHAADAGIVLPAVRIESGAIATSSTTVRTWRANVDGRSRTLHHVLDPRTGQPAESGLRTVTVAASTCVTANAASTAAIVVGHAHAATWLAERQLSARLVDDEAGTIFVAGWPKDGQED